MLESLSIYPKNDVVYFNLAAKGCGEKDVLCNIDENRFTLGSATLPPRQNYLHCIKEGLKRASKSVTRWQGRNRLTVQAAISYFAHSKQHFVGCGSCCSWRAETAAAEHCLEVLHFFFSNPSMLASCLAMVCSVLVQDLGIGRWALEQFQMEWFLIHFV